MDLLTEMRIPTRAAPRPPVNNLNNLATQRSTNGVVWGSSNDLFGSTLQVPQKKKPPPRPPPPKFVIKNVNNEEKPKKTARPTELLTNLFGRRGSKHHRQTVTSGLGTTSTIISNGSSSSSTTSRTTSTTFQLPTVPKPSDGANTSVCLIDLSPPGSPTFTTRSSSDGVSVDSFGSDGNSNPSIFASSGSGSTSQTESAFEDDFDFFGSLSSSKKTGSSDPWKVSCSQDPFGSIESATTSKPSFQQWSTTSQQQQQVKEIGESSFFAFNDGGPFDSQSSKPAFVMPTIIRGIPRKGAPPKPVVPATPSSFISNNYSGAPRLFPSEPPSNSESGKLYWDDDDDDGVKNGSPPMPSQPPPPPPPEYIAGLEDGLVENSERPYGIALYDFAAAQAGDLDLKEGDVVYLTNLINDNWMEGRVGSREGMFPVNFLDIKIPLPGLRTNLVNALYTFKAETNEDLSFEEGARIQVLSRISADWLYGECNGKKGQFPANFVDKVPSDLPNHL